MSADIDLLCEVAWGVRLRRLPIASRSPIPFPRLAALGRAEKELDDSESDDSGAISRLDLCLRTGRRTDCSRSLSEPAALGALPLEAAVRRVELCARDRRGSSSSTGCCWFAGSRTNCCTAMGPWSGHDRTLADSFRSCSTLVEASIEQYLPSSTAMPHFSHWM
jgi:hypothetical protein